VAGNSNSGNYTKGRPHLDGKRGNKIKGRQHPNQARGIPPEEFQCKAICRRTGLRCKKWRLVDATTCEFHGGRQGQKRTRLADVKPFYRNVLSKTLQDTLEDALDEDSSEQVSLLTELALMRMTCLESVKLFSASQEQGVNDKTKDKASQLMVMALKNVQSLAESAIRIQTQAKDSVSIGSLKVVVHQITRIIYEMVPDEDIAMEIERRIKERVKLPDQGGTVLTPDQDVNEMDDSIPRE